MQTQTEGGKSKRKTAAGRKDSDGQSQVIKPKIISEREDELVDLKTKAVEAAENYSKAINQAAEDSGYNAATVRKYVEAKAGDKYDATREKVTQLALIFDVE